MHRLHRIPSPRRQLYQTGLFTMAVYNLLMGAFIVLVPRASLWLHALQADDIGKLGVAFWQGQGTLIALFGGVYLLGSRDPERYAPAVFVAAIGKFLGPPAYGVAYWQSLLPGKMAWMIFFNDVIWWIVLVPFVIETILQRRYEPR